MKIRANKELALKFYDLGSLIQKLHWIIAIDRELKDEEIWKYFGVIDELIIQLVQLKGETRGHILERKNDER